LRVLLEQALGACVLVGREVARLVVDVAAGDQRVAPMVAYCCAVVALRLPPWLTAACWPTAAPVAMAAATGSPAATAWAAAPTALAAPKALPRPACEPVCSETTGRRLV